MRVLFRAAKIMVAQARRFRRDAWVLRNAASVARYFDRQIAIGLLRDAVRLRPDISDFREALAFEYWSAARRNTRGDRSRWAVLAVAEYRACIALEKDERAKLRLIGFAGDVAVWAGDLEQATTWANQALRYGAEHGGQWYTGNLLHHGHRILGLVAVAETRWDDAKRHLIDSCRVPSTPQLQSFGPTFSLAQALLEKKVGAEDAVVRALTDCKVVWPLGAATLDRWISKVRHGALPDMVHWPHAE